MDDCDSITRYALSRQTIGQDKQWGRHLRPMRIASLCPFAADHGTWLWASGLATKFPLLASVGVRGCRCFGRLSMAYQPVVGGCSVFREMGYFGWLMLENA